MQRRKNTARRSHTNNTRRNIFSKNIIDIKYVSKTRKGGRQRSRALFVVGGNEKQHSITYGKAKHNINNRQTISTLIDRASVKFQKNLVKVATYKDTVAHSITCSFYGLKIIIMQSFNGYIEGNEVVRSICGLVGIKSLKVKMIGNTSSKIKQVYAFINTLKSIESIKEISHRTGRNIGEILNRKVKFGRRLSPSYMDDTNTISVDSKDISKVDSNYTVIKNHNISSTMPLTNTKLKTSSMDTNIINNTNTGDKK